MVRMCSAESLLAGLTSRATSAETQAAQAKRDVEELAAEKAELEQELTEARTAADELAKQLRMESEAYEARIRALNDRAVELREKCDEMERGGEALAEELKAKQVRRSRGGLGAC